MDHGEVIPRHRLVYDEVEREHLIETRYGVAVVFPNPPVSQGDETDLEWARRVNEEVDGLCCPPEFGHDLIVAGKEVGYDERESSFHLWFYKRCAALIDSVKPAPEFF